MYFLDTLLKLDLLFVSTHEQFKIGAGREEGGRNIRESSASDFLRVGSCSIKIM